MIDKEETLLSLGFVTERELCLMSESEIEEIYESFLENKGDDCIGI